LAQEQEALKQVLPVLLFTDCHLLRWRLFDTVVFPAKIGNGTA
jgi:hypothetical protein